MVYHYTIRGGSCRNGHSNIDLKPDDITCYVGRDKHENEYLIKYGWPGDVWFHVEGLSSAHVYFRLKNVDRVSSIPMDDLPEESVEDMKQIVKHNSIQGSKLASCKIVWTPHSNLKKTFEMEAGSVTYHNTKLCRYERCEKDRTRIKQLEKTKTERANVNYFEEMKENERQIIDRKKRERATTANTSTNNSAAGDTDIYDPIEADLKAEKHKLRRQGDALSGIDTGLAALEDIVLTATPNDDSHHPVNSSSIGTEMVSSIEDISNNDPLWMQESTSRMEESSATIRFLRARGYTAQAAAQVSDSSKSPVDALAKLWHQPVMTMQWPEVIMPSNEDLLESRREETEVLQAIFGDDDPGVQFGLTGEEEDSDPIPFDAILPITSYEPPKRYDLPPPLLLEVYVDKDMAPRYPHEPPVLALTGGGLPERWLQELTNRLRSKAVEYCQDAPGEPQIFNLVGFIGEEVELVIAVETQDLEAETTRRRKEARVVAAAQQKEAQAKKRAADEEAGLISADNKGSNYTTEAERRAYAQDVVAAAAMGNQSKQDSKSDDKKQPNTKQKFNTGVTDQKLIEDLFG